MRTNLIILIVGGLISISNVQAQTPISIPDNSFEGITAIVSGPTNFLGAGVAGTNTGSIGAWSASAGASLAGLNSSVASGTTNTVGGPQPPDGLFDVRISLPVGAGASTSLRQTLTTAFLANSVYNLSVLIDPGTSLSLLSGSSLSLESGTTPVTSLSGASLVSLLNPNGQFQTVNLSYTTGAIAPSGNIGIEFDANSVAGIGGSIYLDNFLLTVATVPEPQTWALTAMGSLLVLGFRKYRARKQGGRRGMEEN